MTKCIPMKTAAVIGKTQMCMAKKKLNVSPEIVSPRRRAHAMGA